MDYFLIVSNLLLIVANGLLMAPIYLGLFKKFKVKKSKKGAVK